MGFHPPNWRILHSSFFTLRSSLFTFSYSTTSFRYSIGWLYHNSYF